MSEFPYSNNQIKRFRHKLHDFLGSYRISVGVRLETLVENLQSEGSSHASEAKELSSRFQELLTDLRLIFLNTEEPQLDVQSLKQALYKFIDAIGKIENTRVLLEADSDIEEQSHIAEGFYLIAREAISNAIHHAKPKLVKVSIQTIDSKFNLRIEDNGKGFDTAIVREGYGIDFIRKIVQSLNGDLSIISEIDKGTIVDVTVPYN